VQPGAPRARASQRNLPKGTPLSAAAGRSPLLRIAPQISCVPAVACVPAACFQLRPGSFRTGANVPFYMPNRTKGILLETPCTTCIEAQPGGSGAAGSPPPVPPNGGGCPAPARPAPHLELETLSRKPCPAPHLELGRLQHVRSAGRVGGPRRRPRRRREWPQAWQRRSAASVVHCRLEGTPQPLLQRHIAARRLGQLLGATHAC
jgi:hypothetical protein